MAAPHTHSQAAPRPLLLLATAVAAATFAGCIGTAQAAAAATTTTRTPSTAAPSNTNTTTTSMSTAPPTATPQPLTRVTANGKVFYVFVPTDGNETVRLSQSAAGAGGPSALLQGGATLGGIAVLGTTIEVAAVPPPATTVAGGNGNGAPSSISFGVDSAASAATVGLLWALGYFGVL